MSNFLSLPSIELAQERRRNCKPLLIALSGLITGLIYPIFAFRHRDKNILISFLSIAAFIVIFRGIFPEPPIRGTFVFPIINWIIYSKYGPGLIHIVSVWGITSCSKTEAKLKLFKPLQNEQDAFHLVDRRTKGILKNIFNLDNKTVNEIYKEASEAASNDDRDTPSIDDLNKVLMDEYDQYGTKPVQFCKIDGLRVIPDNLATQTQVNKKSSNNEIETDEDFDSSQEYLERVAKIADVEDKQEEVIKLSTIALKFQERSEAYSFRSIAKYNLEDYEGAIEDITRVIEIDPDDWSYSFRAAIKYDINDFKEAISDYTKAIEINPNDSELFESRGDSKVCLDDYSGAITDYSKAIEINPKNSAAITGKAKAKYCLEDFEGAIIEAKKAIKINPKYSISYYYLAYSKYELGDFLGAIKDVKKAIKNNPEDDRFHYLLSLSEYELGDYESALIDINKAIKIDPEDVDYYSIRGSIKKESKDFKGAIKDYSKAIRLDAEDPYNYKWRGAIKEDEGNLKGALSDWNKAVKLSDDEEVKEWIEEIKGKS